GIRVFHVTGVQTCALPIYNRGGFGHAVAFGDITTGYFLPHSGSFSGERHTAGDGHLHVGEIQLLEVFTVTQGYKQGIEAQERGRSEERREGKGGRREKAKR